jgi:hypothetical protein
MQRVARAAKKAAKSKKIWAVLIVLLLISGAVLWVRNTLTGPEEGVVNSQETLNAINNYSPPKEVTYSGTYLSFTYPGRYKQVGEKLSGSTLETVGLFSTDHSEISVSIGVYPGSLNNDSSITLRKNSPDKYSPVSSPPGTVSFISTQGGFEQDEFIQHGNLVASVVFTAPYQGAIKGDFNSVVNSFKWH